MENGKEIFDKLAEYWNLPGSKSLIRLLEIGITPESFADSSWGSREFGRYVLYYLR